MSLRIADLFMELEIRGNVEQQLDQARTAANQLATAGSEAERRLAQIAGPRGLESDIRRAETRMGSLETSAQQAGRQTRDIEINPQLESQARQAGSRISSSIGDAATQASSRLGEIGQGLGDRMGSMGSSGGASFIAGFGPRVAELGSKAGPIGMAVAGVLAIGIGAGAMLAQGIADGMQMEAAKDKIQAQLGTTDQMMAVIGKAAGDSYVGNFGESVQANMEGIRDAIKGGILNGEENAGDMTQTINGLNTVADLLETDVSDASRAVGALMKSGLVKNSQEAMDVITKGSQRSANAAGDMIDVVAEYSNGWAQAGLSGQFAMALIDQSIENGADSADRGGDALREFGRRVVEEGDTLTATFSDLGFNGEEMYKKFVDGGPEAEAAFDQVFDAINKIEDPAKRAAAAQSLLGDTAGDFINSLSKWDPSKAVKSFGDVANATQNAANVMGDNAAAKMESAKRSIEVSMDGVKASMAQAFGPALTQVSDWVSTHKPEIIGFFVTLTDTILACAQGAISFASGTLRAFAFFSEASSKTIGQVVDQLGTFSSTMGGIIKHIPGMGDMGEAMEKAGDLAQKYDDQLASNADTMRDWADKLDTGNEALGNVRDTIRETGADAVASAELTRALGDQIAEIPDDKSIVIHDNSPETIAKLEALGLKTTTLPDGSVEVTANTDEGQRILDGFISTNTGRKIITYTENQIRDRRVEWSGGADKPQQQGPMMMPDGTARADGAVDLDSVDGPLPSQAVIKPDGAHLIQWSERGTGGEAYIPLASSKRARSAAILADVARRFNLSLTKMEDGGIVDSLTSLAAKKAPALQVTDSYRPGANDLHGAGRAVDFSNGSGNTDEQLAWANYLADNHREDLDELIYDDPRFSGKQIKNGEFVSDSFYAGAGDHTHHVHAAAKRALSEKAVGTGDGAQSNANLTEREKIAMAIIQEGRRRGISDKGIKTALMASLDETDLTNLDYGMDGDNKGILQQRDSWGTAEQRMDPTYAAGKFYEELAKIDYENMDEGDAAQAVQRSGTADGSNYREEAGEADELMAKLGSGTTSTTSSTSSGTTTGGVQDVRVTNWPDGFGAPQTPAEEDKAKARMTIAMFNGGGTVGGSGTEDTEHTLLTPGEEVIKRGPAAKHRRLLKAINAGANIGAFAEGGTVGGFGGYSSSVDTRKLGLNDWLALGVGTGMMAATSVDADGVFQGLDTKATTIPALTKAIKDLADNMPTTITIEHLEMAAENPMEFIQDLTELNPATMAITQKGL